MASSTGIYSQLKRLQILRDTEAAFRWGHIIWWNSSSLGSSVISFIRVAHGNYFEFENQTFLVIANLGATPVSIDVPVFLLSEHGQLIRQRLERLCNLWIQRLVLHHLWVAEGEHSVSANAADGEHRFPFSLLYHKTHFVFANQGTEVTFVHPFNKGDELRPGLILDLKKLIWLKDGQIIVLKLDFSAV